MSTPSDYQLIQYIGQGRREALAQLFDRYSAELYDFIARLVGDRDQAARLLEEVFMRVPGAVAGLPARESVRGWLYSLAREAGLTWLRQKGWLEGLPPSTEPAVPGLVGDIDKAARAMPGFHRAVLSVEELQPLSPTEKARALGVLRTDLPRLTEEARRSFTRQFDQQARTEGRPISAQIDPERVWGLRRRLPNPEGTLFGFLPLTILPESLQQTLRRRVIEAMSTTPRTVTPPPVEPLPPQPQPQFQLPPPLIPLVQPEVIQPQRPVITSTTTERTTTYAPQPVAASNQTMQRNVIAALIGLALALLLCGAIFYLTQDRTPPKIITFTPPNGSSVAFAPNMTVAVTYSEDRELDQARTQLLIDGVPVPTVTIPNGLAYSGPLGLGPHSARAILYDRSGNQQQGDWSFVVAPPSTLTPTATPQPSDTPIPTITPFPTAFPTQFPTPFPTPFPTFFIPTPCDTFIAGNVFNDLNGNGNRDPNDPSLAGIVVNLQNQQGGLIAVGTSDSFGNYQFANLPFGTYRVQVSIPNGWYATTPSIFTVNLFGCGGIFGVDFGFVQTTPTPISTFTPTLTPIIIIVTPTNTPTFTPSLTPIIIIVTPTNTPTLLATLTPTVTPTPSTPPFAITGAVAAVTPPAPGPCPKPITFSGSLTANGAGSATYHWKRSDGSTGSDQILTFFAAGPQPVNNDVWVVGAPATVFMIWEQIEVVTPNSLTSNQANFTLVCP